MDGPIISEYTYFIFYPLFYRLREILREYPTKYAAAAIWADTK